MHSKSIVAGALLAAAPMARATGSVRVHNACSFPVYLWSVSAESGPMQTINSGDNYSEAYQTNPNGGGVSLKISPSTSQASGVTQFEYTMDSTLWYDLSNINGWPFEKWGATLMPSDNSCRNVLCPAGVALCSQAYNQPDENWATAACGTESNMNLVLCSQQDNESTPSQIALNAVNGVIKGTHSHIKAKVNKPAAPAAPAPPAPAVPAPAATPAPAAPAAPVAGALTTFVTNIVTVTARDAEPSLAVEQPVRRHMHQHHHHHHA